QRRRGGRTRGRHCWFTIHQILDFLAGLEEKNFLGRDFHPLPGLGIAAHPRLTLPDSKTAKTPDFNRISDAQRTYYAVKDSLDNSFRYCELANHPAHKRITFDSQNG